MAIRDAYLLKRSPVFHLAPRQEATVDLTLEKAPKPPSTVLSGIVTGKCGPVAGATVKVFSRGWQPLAHVETGPDGRFSFFHLLPPGEYIVLASADGYRVSMEYRLRLLMNIPLSITIRLEHARYQGLGTVYGVAFDSLKKPLGEVSIFLKAEAGAGTTTAATMTNDDGEYLVYGLKPGLYQITASKPGYLLPMARTIEVLPDGIFQADLWLYPDPAASDGTISGRITHGGRPVPGAVAALYRQEYGSHRLLALSETNAAGAYLFGSAQPGDYVVKAKQEAEDDF